MSPGLASKRRANCSGSSRGYRVSAWILLLPSETIEGIFEHVRHSDLLNLALTCRPFHGLAMTQLYRRVSYIFGSSGPSAKQSLDQFTSILETLATSEYNYAQFIRQISLERSNAADTVRGEFRGGVDYAYACEKLLNTLLLIVLKRVTGLESFRWDIYMELRMPVFETLSKMPTLQNLYIRVPGVLGPRPGSFSFNNALPASLTAAPPPAPGVPQPVDITGLVPTHTQINEINSFQSHVSPHHYHPTINSQTVIPVEPNQTKLLQGGKGSNSSIYRMQGLSLISGLKRLAVLEIDNLRFIAELAQAVHSNASTIRSIEFSLSEQLALRARGKNGAEPSDSDSVSEADDWGVSNAHVPPAPHTTIFPPPVVGASTTSPSNDPEVRGARVAQEALLAQIFGVKEPATQLEEPATQPHIDQVLEEAILTGEQKPQKDTKTAPKESESRIFMHSAGRAVRELNAAIKGGTWPGRNRTQEAIQSATDRFLDNKYMQYIKTGNATASTAESGSQIPGKEAEENVAGINIPLLSSSNSQHVADSGVSTATETKQELPDAPTPPTVSFSSVHKKLDDNLSDIVDMEHPDDVEEPVEDQEFLDLSKDGGSDATTIPVSGQRPLDEEPEISKTSKGKKAVREIKDEAPSSDVDSKPKWASPEEYIRSTHGIPLDSLSLHLIPVKLAVLCRAVDVFSLKHLSLLNVGPQRTIWAMLAKLHQTRPLQLSSIHTDNVTHSFLSFVNGLDRITELFMFECSRRASVESFASKTTVKVEDIRYQILLKHAENLQRLLIRNDEDSSWVLTPSIIRQLAFQGSNLIELGVGLSPLSYHAFLQNIGFFRPLVALQIFYHQSDKCNTMLRELRNCIVDHISHFKHHRLKYVSMGYVAHGPVYNHVLHISKRPSQEADILRMLMLSRVDTGRLEKGTATALLTGLSSMSMSSPGQQSPEDSDGAIDQARAGSEITVKHTKMSDVVGIKIFTKEVLGIKL